MIKGIEAVMLNSQDAKKLSKFYAGVVGVKIGEEYQMGKKQNAYEMKTKNGSAFYINDHSEVKGKNKEPQRVILNLEVGDVEKEVARLKKAKVKVIADTYHIEGYGLIATFQDIDGNYFQLVQVKAS